MKKTEQQPLTKQTNTKNMDLSYILRTAFGNAEMKNLENYDIQVVATDEFLAGELNARFNEVGATKVKTAYLTPVDPVPLHERRTRRFPNREAVAYVPPKAEEEPIMPPVVGIPERVIATDVPETIEVAEEVSKEEIESGVEVTATAQLVEEKVEEPKTVEEEEETPTLSTEEPMLPPVVGIPEEKTAEEEVTAEEVDSTEETEIQTEDAPAPETPKDKKTLKVEMKEAKKQEKLQKKAQKEAEKQAKKEAKLQKKASK